MTSGLIVMTVAYGLYFMTSVEAISGLGQLIGRGALISVILVLFFLPMMPDVCSTAGSSSRITQKRNTPR